MLTLWYVIFEMYAYLGPWVQSGGETQRVGTGAGFHIVSSGTLFKMHALILKNKLNLL